MSALGTGDRLLASVADALSVLALHTVRHDSNSGKDLCAICAVNRTITHPCKYVRLAKDWLAQNGQPMKPKKP